MKQVLQPHQAAWGWAFAALLLAAFNLRLALTSVSPILAELGQALGLTAVGLSWLTTLPVLLMGLAAPLAPVLLRSWGLERAVLLALGVLLWAQALRPFVGGAAGFFFGSACAGAAIGVLGVLLPAWVKRDFASRVGVVTGAYTMVLSLGAALAAGATEPLRLALGGAWQWALALWALPALLAWFFWQFLLPKTPIAAAPTQSGLKIITKPTGSLLRQRLAWQITLFMGLQSALAYSVFSWLPTLLLARGLDAVTAGWVLSVLILVSTAAAFLTPWLSSKLPDERAMNTLSLLCYGAGIAGCWLAPVSQLWWWQAVLGLGLGGGFAMALLLLAVRAPNTEVAGRLSAMAQGWGYVLAALGPWGVGWLQAQYSWAATALLLELIVVAGLWMGWRSGRLQLLPER